jgi:hypothetical protein
MKTENTLENKARFFAQHWGQKILLRVEATNDTVSLGFVNEATMSFLPIFKPVLQLTSLSAITDEDAIHVSKLSFIKIIKSHTAVSGKSILHGIFKIDFDGMFIRNPEYREVIDIVDHLRSKGYALPWMDLSVKELIEYGWIKLTE